MSKDLMKYEDKIEDMIESYRFTVIALSISIVLMFLLFAVVVTYLIFLQLPDVIVMALDTYFAENEFILYED